MPPTALDDARNDSFLMACPILLDAIGWRKLRAAGWVRSEVLRMIDRLVRYELVCLEPGRDGLRVRLTEFGELHVRAATAPAPVGG